MTVNMFPLFSSRKLHDDFCKARGWGKFHLPRNILLAMVGEVGEIAELLWVPSSL